MYTTYHFNSATELNADILEAIKLTYKSKPITLIIEEQEDNYELTDEEKQILDERLLEDENSFIPVSKVMEDLKAKYNV
jgi:hypothetical protein